MSIEEYEKELAEVYGGFDKQEDGSYIINFCGSPHLIPPFGGGSKFKTKEQALNEYKKGLKKMKTVKDVVAAYPDGWPNEDAAVIGYKKSIELFINCASGYLFTDDEYKICTREEYEQELAETKDELKINTDGFDHPIRHERTKRLELDRSTEWYDYDKQEAISLPPVGVECEVSNCGNGYEWCKTGFVGEYLCVVNHKGYNEQHYHISSVKFRPLDHDKNKQRDEFIDECVRVTTLSAGQAVIAFGDLYDAGARFK